MYYEELDFYADELITDEGEELCIEEALTVSLDSAIIKPIGTGFEVFLFSTIYINDERLDDDVQLRSGFRVPFSSTCSREDITKKFSIESISGIDTLFVTAYFDRTSSVMIDTLEATIIEDKILETLGRKGVFEIDLQV